MRLQVADVLDKQLNVDSDGLQAAHVLRLRQITLRTLCEARPSVRSARQVHINLGHLLLQALLGLFLADSADAHADANAAVALVDKESAVSADRDAARAGRSHGCLLSCERRNTTSSDGRIKSGAAPLPDRPGQGRRCGAELTTGRGVLLVGWC